MEMEGDIRGGRMAKWLVHFHLSSKAETVGAQKQTFSID